jgi:predicted DNA-binding protein (MmcQ/YjbR family)
MEKRGVEQEFKAEWNSPTLPHRGGKIFLMLGEYKDGRPLMTVKLDPAFFRNPARSSTLEKSSPATIPTNAL